MMIQLPEIYSLIFKKRAGYRCIANFAKALSTTVIEEKYGYSFFF
jgi:hypothetical protein